MEKNVGGHDRKIRNVAGILLVVLGTFMLYYQPVADKKLILGIAGISFVLGISFLVTAISEKCVINELIGRNTYEAEK